MDPEQAAGLLSTLALLRDLGAYGGLGLLVWLLLTGRVVTRGHLNDVVAAERAQTVDARAERDEWKSEAKRLANDIVPPLATVARAHVQEQRQELRELQGPR